MTPESGLERMVRKMLENSDLSFQDFMELALYHPEEGYYARSENPIGKTGDYATAPVLSPVFSHAFGNLVREFLSLPGDAPSTVVDIGCGDGKLVHDLAHAGTGFSPPESGLKPAPTFLGVDRSLSRIAAGDRVRFVRTIGEVPKEGRHLIICNELYDAFPFARLVQRDEHLHELWVTERDGRLDWTEHEATPVYEDYFVARGLELEDGQFVDLSLEWEAFHGELCAAFPRSLIVTLDYGFRDRQLFDARIRRFGTAASYTQHRVTRDLLVDPGRRDLTAHINFSDLERAGSARGFHTMFYDGLAKFLLLLGAAEHPLLAPLEEDVDLGSAAEALALREEREAARRLVLPDGIGEEMRVLVQSGELPVHEWSLRRKLF